MQQPEKRSGKGSDDKPSKKFKDSTGKAKDFPSKVKGKGQVGGFRCLNCYVMLWCRRPLVRWSCCGFHFLIFLQGDFVADSPKPADLPKVTKQDIPNRFWAMVEPYCAEISNDDLKVSYIWCNIWHLTLVKFDILSYICRRQWKRVRRQAKVSPLNQQ